MTKRWGLILAAVLLLCLGSCSGRDALAVTDASEVVSRVASGDDYDVYVHEATGVWYLYVRGCSRGGLAAMVDADGTPYTGG